MTRRPPTSPLFPYTTLFRSIGSSLHHRPGVVPAERRCKRTDVSGIQLRHQSGAGAAREKEQQTGVRLWTVPATSPASFRSEAQRLNSSHSQISYAVFCLKKK